MTQRSRLEGDEVVLGDLDHLRGLVERVLAQPVELLVQVRAVVLLVPHHRVSA